MKDGMSEKFTRPSKLQSPSKKGSGSSLIVATELLDAANRYGVSTKPIELR